MAIRIITDSTSDITQKQASQLGITVVPLQIHIDGTSYRDGIDIDFDQFYSMLPDASALPTTSQPAPEEFVSHFQTAKENGDHVIAILLSSTLSGTYQSAVIAKDIVGYDNIHIIDSRQSIIALRLLVEYAIKLIDAGKSVLEIVDKIEAAKNKIVILAMVDTLDYLVKSGRLPKTAGFVGSLLNIKPLVTLKAGMLGVWGKARGLKNSIKTIATEMYSLPIDHTCPVYFGYTEVAENGNQLRSAVCEAFNLKDCGMYPVGSVIGTHVGGGAMAVAYLSK